MSAVFALSTREDASKVRRAIAIADTIDACYHVKGLEFSVRPCPAMTGRWASTGVGGDFDPGIPHRVRPRMSEPLDKLGAGSPSPLGEGKKRSAPRKDPGRIEESPRLRAAWATGRDYGADCGLGVEDGGYLAG